MTMRPSWHRVGCIASMIAASSAFGQTTQEDLGKASFEQCATCHTIDGGDGVGPTLQGIAGRKAATVDGFRYSRALRSAGITWDAASLDAFLAEPQKAVPGNVMPFSGMTDARQRAAVIAYLLSLPPNARP